MGRKRTSPDALHRWGPGRLASTAVKLARAQGLGWLLFRLGYELRLKTGLVRHRLPAYTWESRPLAYWLKDGIPSDPAAYLNWRAEQTRPFFFDIRDPQLRPALQHFPDTGTGANRVLNGEWSYFSHRVFRVGFPPDWHSNPLTKERSPSDRHWSELGDFDFGDIKLIWEASRFGVVYALARPYAASGDERYPAAFWSLVEDWAEKNPPQLGVNWKCGQEATVRVMAWCFGWHAFRTSMHSTAERFALLVGMLAAHAERIEGNTAYARSQKNNHAISEAVGLWTIGLIFAELKNAERWRELGRQILEEEARRQIYSDGAYVQHSMNYHRVMLHNYLWALRLGELCSHTLSTEVTSRVDRACQFLRQFVDPETGEVPNYGANDGALVLPLNGCDYRDFRPVVEAVNFLLHKSFVYPPGPWDEDLAWLFGPEAACREGADQRASLPVEISKPEQHSPLAVSPAVFSAPDGGYYVLKGKESRAMIRCARFKDRPGHADQLHLDLWWKGINIACDGGTWLYNPEYPWDKGWAGTSAHNTLTVDDQDQMKRAGRFLWLDWAQGTVRKTTVSSRGLLGSWEGEHGGYRRLGVTHRRAATCLGDDIWLVVDDVVGMGRHSVRLHWLLLDCGHALDAAERRLLLHTPQGDFLVQTWCGGAADFELVRAGKMLHPKPDSADSRVADADGITTRGWQSRYYADKEPAFSLSLVTRGELPVRFITILSPATIEVGRLDVSRIEVERSKARCTAELSSPGVSPIFKRASLVRDNSTENLLPRGASTNG